MAPWARRLKDLSQLLANCDATYYAPETFRLNTNNFLQTARTITFLIQKQKAAIPQFEKWYADNVVAPWGADHVMTWAKDSRNTIEKEGDLELHSELSATLICSYVDEENIKIKCGRDELLRASAVRLVRFAQKALPSGSVQQAVLKLERRWVANTLPAFELLTALAYIYTRTYAVCRALCEQLGIELDDSIRKPNDDALLGAGRMTAYMKLRGVGDVIRLRASRIYRDDAVKFPPGMVEAQEKARIVQPTSLETCVERCALMAKGAFVAQGCYYPALFLFDEKWRCVDMVGTMFRDKPEKFIFFYHAAERALTARAYAAVWACESWHHDMTGQPSYRAVKDMPIVGELLQVHGIDRDGHWVHKSWKIERDSADRKPSLVTISAPMSRPFCLMPIERAFARINGP